MKINGIETLMYFVGNSTVPTTERIHLRSLPSFSAPRKPVSLSIFRDESIIKKGRKKIVLPFGKDHSDATDSFMDTIPVSVRQTVLNSLIENDFSLRQFQTRKELHSILARMKPDGSLAKTYLHYLLGSMYLESGVVGPFTRIGFKEYNVVFQNCGEFVEYMRNYFKTTYNFPLDHVTPRILHDWFLSFGRVGFFGLTIDREYADKTFSDIPPTSVVFLEFEPWRIILKNRLHRLSISGYENIDL